MSERMFNKEFTFHSKDDKVINGKVEIYWLNNRWELHLRLEDYELNPEYSDIQQEFIDYCNGFKRTKFVTEDTKKEVLEMLEEYIENIEEEEDDRVYTWEDYDNFVLNNSFPDDLEELDDKVIALATHLEISPNEAQDDISEQSYDDCCFDYGKREYYVYTERERDSNGLERAENLIDECYLTDEIRNSWIYRHFDMDSAIEEVISDGYGNLFASYDGAEYEEDVNGNTYYIYRAN
jgi:hypothetical protein